MIRWDYADTNASDDDADGLLKLMGSSLYAFDAMVDDVGITVGETDVLPFECVFG